MTGAGVWWGGGEGAGVWWGGGELDGGVEGDEGCGVGDRRGVGDEGKGEGR